MIKLLIDRPIAVLVSFLSLVLLGLAAGNMLPTSLLPDTDIPKIHVRISAPNLSAAEAERSITTPLRNTLQQLRGLEYMESMSGEGMANLRLGFEQDMDMSMAFISVNEKVDMAMNELPRDMERPQVVRQSVADIPVFHLQIRDSAGSWEESRLAEMSSMAREVIRRRLEQLPEVAMVDISGLSQPQVQLLPKMGYLRVLNIDVSRLQEAFAENKLSLGSVIVQDGHYRYYLHSASPMQSLDALGSIPLHIGSRVFALRELVDLRLSNAPGTGAFFEGRHRAIDLAIIKQSRARMEDLQQRFAELLGHLRKDYPELSFTVSQDQTALLDYAVGNLKQDLLLGGLLAFLCILLFIRKIKPAILVGITVPIALTVSQLGFYLFGISINIISLGGLILGLGMIIDNSIVVIETISLHQGKSGNASDAIVKGTNEIIMPLFSSMLTNCAVFVPLIFMSGMASALFYDQALSVTIGVVSSLLVAVFLLPPLFLFIHRVRPFKRPLPQIPSYVSVTNWYDLGMKWVFGHKLATFSIVLFFLAVGIFCFVRLDRQRLPPISREDMELAVDWNGYVPLDDSKERVASLLEQYSQLVDSYHVWVGTQQYLLSDLRHMGPNELRAYIRAKDPDAMAYLGRQLEQVLSVSYPTADVQITAATNAFDAVFGQKGSSLNILLQDAGNRERPGKHWAKVLTDNLRVALPHAHIASVALQRKLVLHIDDERAAIYGVGIQEVNEALRRAFSSLQLDYFEGAESLVPIVLVPTSFDSVSDLLANSHVYGRDRVRLPLSTFVRTKLDEGYRYLHAGKEGGYYPIEVDTDHPEADLVNIKQVLASFSGQLEAGYSGSYFENRQLLRQMAVILLVSVLLLYFILAAQFESLLQPLFILAELPIALMGAVVALYVGGNSINLMSLIGMVIMSGLVINDSILKIDAINRLRHGGMPLAEAIHEGGLRRLKPIVMISLTSIGALAPTLFMHDMGSELQRPLSLALLGGMSVGLLVSLFFVPLIYWLVYRRAERLKRGIGR